MRPSGPTLTKREFLSASGRGICALGLAGLLQGPQTARAQTPKRGLLGPRPSLYFTALEGGEIRCDLCPRHCRIPKGKRGFCRMRENRQGECYSLVYGTPCAFHLDPMERNPFFHVLPGTASLSIATAGCTFECKFCQAWEVSQANPEETFNHEIPPELVVRRAREMGARSVAFTFVEPTVSLEYALDVFRLARDAGFLNVIHSNGYVGSRPLQDLLGVIHAANIDLKGFSEAFYREVCGGELAPVLETLKALRRHGTHLEITHLIIPTRNDDMALIREMCLWIVQALGPETPLHFFRFYPLYKLKGLPPTPVSTLEAARKIAMEVGLRYAYLGNVPSHEGENTHCPQCRLRVVERTGYMVERVLLQDGKCEACGQPIPGLWG